MHLIRQAGGRWQRLLVTALCLASVSCATRAPPRTEPARAETPQTLPAPKPASQVPAEVKAPAVEVRIAAVGDIMLGGTAGPEMQKYGYDYPFERTQSLLKQAQIVFGNLEGPLTGGGATETPKKYVFRSPPDKVAPALARAGFNIVSLANNHSLDYGPQGLEDTRAALEKGGVQGGGEERAGYGFRSRAGRAGGRDGGAPDSRYRGGFVPLGPGG